VHTLAAIAGSTMPQWCLLSTLFAAAAGCAWRSPSSLMTSQRRGSRFSAIGRAFRRSGSIQAAVGTVERQRAVYVGVATAEPWPLFYQYFTKQSPSRNIDASDWIQELSFGTPCSFLNGLGPLDGWG
jgi:hypothetical protein